MTAPTEDLIARLEQWPNHKTGADYSLSQVQDQQKEAAQALRALQAEVERLRGACVAIQRLEHTEENEWDAVETVIPAMVAIATKALTRASTKDDCGPLQSR